MPKEQWKHVGNSVTMVWRRHLDMLLEQSKGLQSYDHTQRCGWGHECKAV